MKALRYFSLKLLFAMLLILLCFGLSRLTALDRNLLLIFSGIGALLISLIPYRTGSIFSKYERNKTLDNDQDTKRILVKLQIDADFRFFVGWVLIGLPAFILGLIG